MTIWVTLEKTLDGMFRKICTRIGRPHFLTCTSFTDSHLIGFADNTSRYKNLNPETINTYGLLYTWKGSDPSLKPLLMMAHSGRILPYDFSPLLFFDHCNFRCRTSGPKYSRPMGPSPFLWLLRWRESMGKRVFGCTRFPFSFLLVDIMLTVSRIKVVWLEHCKLTLPFI